ncbi:D-glycerate dehydrogenase [Alcaligenaceae bacterium]|nr:D-glycerate dehydrogenase [Alcaligenaceae bacterium]
MDEQPCLIVCAPIGRRALALLRQDWEVVELPADPQALASCPPELARRARVIICTITLRVDAAVLAMFPGLSAISNVAVGYDNIDLAAAARAGVAVCHTPGVLDQSVADLAFGLVLCLARGIVRHDRFVRSGQWLRQAAPLMTELAGKTLGIIGMGRIGIQVARRAATFGMDVLYADAREMPAEAGAIAARVDMDTLLQQADFLSIHVPLTPQTKMMIGPRELRRMKPGAYLINTSRGEVIDEPALIAALSEGRLAGAGLDVAWQEPLPPDHALLALDNVVVQPHVGSATRESRHAMIAMAVENARLAMAGRPPLAMVPAQAVSQQ